MENKLIKKNSFKLLIDEGVEPHEIMYVINPNPSDEVLDEMAQSRKSK